MDDDKAVGKRTTVVIFGRKVMGTAYLLLHIRTWRRLVTNTGAVLNPVLGITARNLLMFSLMLLFTLIIDTL